MALKLDYMVRETGTNLFRNLSLTIASILTVAVSLSLVGGSVLLRYAVDNATQQWQGGIEFIVFMQPEATEDQTEAVERQLEESTQVERYVYFDQDETFEEFKSLFQNTPQIVESVTPEILPPSFRVVPVDKSAETIESLRSVFVTQPGVREVVAAFDSIRTIRNLSNLIGVGLFVVAGFLLLAATLLILNSIRMAMFARRREIEVMKLVGASNWFIRIPFMLEGVFQGVIGSGFAIGVVFGVQRIFDNIAADQRFSLFSGLVVDNQQVMTTSVFVMVTGVLIGALGSAFAVSRFLDV
jgi:cell division transport system permease protein